MMVLLHTVYMYSAHTGLRQCCMGTGGRTISESAGPLNRHQQISFPPRAHAWRRVKPLQSRRKDYLQLNVK